MSPGLNWKAGGVPAVSVDRAGLVPTPPVSNGKQLSCWDADGIWGIVLQEGTEAMTPGEPIAFDICMTLVYS